MAVRLEIKWVDEIDSTNSEILRDISKWDDMQTLAAWNQTAGRGQRGNSWKIRSKESLTFSTILKGASLCPEGTLGRLAARNQFIISEIAAISVRDYLRSKGVDAKIKWPNDIYVGNRKICGMLIENGLSSDGLIAYSVIGIGININQREFSPEVLNPTSLSLLTGRNDYDLQKELAEFISIFADKLSLLDNPEKAKKDFCNDLYRLDQWHNYTDCLSAEVVKARIKGITDEGLVIMEMSDSSLKEYAFKEISYII